MPVPPTSPFPYRKGGGPWMHGIHFGFSLGAFLAPIVAAPFLSNTEEVSKIVLSGCFIIL